MDFTQYCEIKKIDVLRFKMEEPELYNELESYFQEIHPESFTQQKKFLINPIRRKYPMLRHLKL